MKVYVVMGNDYPESVWGTEELANTHVEKSALKTKFDMKKSTQVGDTLQ